MLLVALDIKFSKVLETVFSQNVHDPINATLGDAKAKKTKKVKVDKKKLEKRRVALRK